MQDEFTGQTVTILLPIDSEDLKTALNLDCIEDSTKIINNIFKCNIDLDLDTSKSKQEDDTSTVELEDFVSECIYEPFDDVKESMTKGKEINIEEKKILKKVKLVDLLMKDDEDFSETPLEHKIESVREANSEKQDEKLQNIESLKRKHQQSHDDDMIKQEPKNKTDAVSVHIQSKHEGVQYPCDQCNLQYTTQSSLRRHISSLHWSVKSHIKG